VIAPNIDVRENDKEITFEAELPGIDEKDVQITVRDGVLSLKGEKKSDHAGGDRLVVVTVDQDEAAGRAVGFAALQDPHR
jgi:HSP20 family molecular chaperone IbpA